jgi:hypothetical protein
MFYIGNVVQLYTLSTFTQNNILLLLQFLNCDLSVVTIFANCENFLKVKLGAKNYTYLHEKVFYT